ncbi:MAG: aminotransferase class V-fold PLP-dependent enzyme [Acidobacteriota bacterium]|nr:aminotransferase class V-fold PLP-dependent enzyme [Acidobacteriota bacterium]
MAKQAEEGAAAGILQKFLEAFPEYPQTEILDRLRREEFSRLDEQGQVYLDYTGGGLYGEEQIRRHFELLRSTVFGNPHSFNPTSTRTSELVERCRRRVLEFFGANPQEYVLIFTANASQALKLVGEAYPFSAGDRFLLTFDNHNSVNGIREFDRVRGAETRYVPVEPPDLRVDRQVLEEQLREPVQGEHKLFAFPAQSNFSGVQHPLEWVALAHEHGWDVLLDAAAFVPTNRLDLSRWHPDFVALSFYKMFGYPTGVGALIARREALGKLHRPWFAGGTITVASVQADRHFLAPGGAAFEDGTLDYANIPAVEMGLDFLERAGIEVIHQRVRCLTGWLLRRLQELRHSNGEPLLRIYGPIDEEGRGGTVTVNFRDAQGRFIDHQLIERRAAEEGISIRTGCFCNPGAGEMAMGLSRGELDSCLSGHEDRLSYDDFHNCITEKGTGAVRISVGLASNLKDVEAFVAFAGRLLDRGRLG